MNWKQHNRYKLGGKQLPGGTMTPLNGGAVEFTGKTHEKGGIHLDEMTEVEDGETMDKVLGKDYFFSNHLKLNGSTFASLHKRLLTKNASQSEIDSLAERQELISGRSGDNSIQSQVVQAEYGGYRKQKLEDGGYPDQIKTKKQKTWYDAQIKKGGYWKDGSMWKSEDAYNKDQKDKEVEKTLTTEQKTLLSWIGKSKKQLEKIHGTSVLPENISNFLIWEKDLNMYIADFDTYDKPGQLLPIGYSPFGHVNSPLWTPAKEADLTPTEEGRAYIESNTGQFHEGRYYDDEEETGDIKFEDLSKDAQDYVNTMRGAMTPVDFNVEGYKGDRTKAALALSTEQFESDKKEGIESYTSWYDIPADAGNTVRVNGVLYKKNEDGTSWVNMDDSEIEISDEEEDERKNQTALNIESEKEKTGDYTKEEKEIMAKQQILVDAGHDLGKTGPNEDGVDGDWGNKSEKAQAIYDKAQIEIKEKATEKEIKEKKIMEEKEIQEIENRKISDTKYIEDANREAREADLGEIDMSQWALVDVGGEQVYVPYKDRFKYSAIPGQENSDPVEANKAYQEMLSGRENVLGTSLGEGAYKDEEGNLYEKDGQGRWRVKYMVNQEFGDGQLEEEWTTLSPDMYPGEMNLTKHIETKTMMQRLQDMKTDKDLISMATSAAQLIPAYMAYKDKPNYMDTPGKMPMTKLDRVNYNNDRQTAAADYRALSRGLELSGTGPGEISNKMMAYSKKQAANMAITAKETQKNTEIENKEAEMNQIAKANNIKNTMAVNEFNKAADAATTDRKIEATQNAMTSLAGMNRDRLQYQASENLTIATAGATGVMNRFDQRIKAMQISGTTDVSDPRYIAAFNSLGKNNSQ